MRDHQIFQKSRRSCRIDGYEDWDSVLNYSQDGKASYYIMKKSENNIHTKVIYLRYDAEMNECSAEAYILGLPSIISKQRCKAAFLTSPETGECLKKAENKLEDKIYNRYGWFNSFYYPRREIKTLLFYIILMFVVITSLDIVI